MFVLFSAFCRKGTSFLFLTIFRKGTSEEAEKQIYACMFILAGLIHLVQNAVLAPGDGYVQGIDP